MKKLIGLSSLVLVALVLVLTTAMAQPGDLDPTWGEDGLTLTDFGGADDLANANALMPGGNWVVAGWVNSYPGDFGMARYRTNGSLDPTFGNGGKVVTEFTNDADAVDAAWQVVARPNGGVFTIGDVCDADYIVCQIGVAAYLADGSLDDSFGTGGLVTTDPGTATAFAWPTRTVLQPDGKLVVSGVVMYDDDTVDLLFIRYNPDGSLDDTYGTDGITILDLAGVDNFVQDVVAVPGDKIVAVGLFGAFIDPLSTEADAGYLTRMNSDGTLDLSFGGGDGYVTWDNGGEPTSGRYVLVTPDNKLLALSAQLVGADQDCTLRRYDMDGVLDITYGDNGQVIIDLGQDEGCLKMAFTPDDKLAIIGPTVPVPSAAAVAGESAKVALRGGSLGNRTSVGQSPAARSAQEDELGNYLALYNLDGTPDTTFGDDGFVRYNIYEGTGTGYNLAVQSDGDFLIAGDVVVGGSSDFGVMRFLGDAPFLQPGALDPTWGKNGLATVNITGNDDPITTMVLDADGKVTMAGWVNGYPGEFGVARLLQNGRLDQSFGNGGKVTTRLTSDPDMPNAPWTMGQRANGGYVVSGDICDPDYIVCEWGTAVYLPDGSLDTSFSDDGLVITGMDDVFTIYAWPYRLVTQADGGTVIGGVVIQDDLDVDVALHRYKADGTLDPAYGTNGIAVHDFDDTSNYMESMRPMPGNKVLVTGGFGESIDVFSYEMDQGFLALFKNDGSLDAAFGNGGTVIWDQDGAAIGPEDLVVGPAGDIYVAGAIADANGGISCGVWRFDAQGNQDQAFGVEGVLRIDLGSDEFCTSIDMLPNGKLAVTGPIYPVMDETRTAATAYQQRGHSQSTAMNRSADVGDTVAGLVARLNADGTLDGTFGDGGVIVSDIQGADNISLIIAAQPDGKVVTGGDVMDPDTETRSMVVKRFLGDGPAAQVYAPVIGR